MAAQAQQSQATVWGADSTVSVDHPSFATSPVELTGAYGATTAQRDGWMARDLQMMLAAHYSETTNRRSAPRLGTIAMLAIVSWAVVAAIGTLIVLVLP